MIINDYQCHNLYNLRQLSHHYGWYKQMWWSKLYYNIFIYGNQYVNIICSKSCSTPSKFGTNRETFSLTLDLIRYL